MPIYEYKCQKCGHVFEEWQSGFEECEQSCPTCGGESKRLISNTSFVLKGTGWYVTDYAGKNPSNGSGEDGKSGKSSETGAESAEPAGSAASASLETTSTTTSNSAS